MNTRKNFKSRKSNKSTRRCRKTMRGGNIEATRTLWIYLQMEASGTEQHIREALINGAFTVRKQMS